MKKTLAIILVVLLSLCTLGPAIATELPEELPEDLTPYYEWADSLDTSGKTFDEPITVTWASAYLNGAAPEDYCDADVLGRWISDHFNIQVDVITLDNASFDTKIRSMLAGDDLPDVVKWYNWYPEEIINAVLEQEQLKKFPENWRERWPNLSRAQDTIPIFEGLGAILGGDYGWFRPIFLNYKPYEHDLTDQDVLYMRKDWIEAVGYEVKEIYNRQEILELARLIKAQDPGKVGDALVPIAGSMNYLRKLFMLHDYPDYKNLVKGANGYEWSFARPEILEGLKVFKTAYSEGLISPEFFSHSDEDGHAMFGYSMIAAMDFDHSNTGHLSDRFNGLIDNGLDWHEIVNLAVIAGEDGYQHGMKSSNFWGYTFFRADCDDAVMERVLDLVDFCFTADGQTLLWQGFKGLDYEVDENGYLRTIRKPVLIRGQSDQLWKSMSTCGDETDLAPLERNAWLSRDIYNYERTEIYKHIFALKDSIWNDDCIMDIDILKSAFHSETQDRFSAIDVDAFIAELIVDKDGDLEASWKAFIEKNMPVVQAAIDELNTELLGM